MTATARRPPDVLVVDDDPGLVRALEILLEDERGLAVATAHSAREALDHLAAEPPPRVMVCDLCLPDLDGMEVARRLRRARRPVIFIAMTAYPDPWRRAAALRAGAVAVLPKPFDPSELLAIVDACLAGDRRA